MMTNFVTNPIIQNLNQFFLCEFKRHMCFTWPLLQWLGSSFTWNTVLYYSGHHLPMWTHSVLFDQAVKDLSLLRCVVFIETDYLWIMIGSKVALFVHNGGLVSSIVSWPLIEVMQIVELVEGNHTLGGGVAFLALNYNFQRLLMLTLIRFYVLESINNVRSATMLSMMVLCKINMSSLYSSMFFVHLNFK